MVSDRKPRQFKPRSPATCRADAAFYSRNLNARAAIGLIVLTCLTLACDSSGNSGSNSSTGAADSGEPPPVTQGDWYRPPVGATWQWQLQPGNAGVNTAYGVTVYEIDLFDAPQAVIDTLRSDGRRVIAYFSAGTFEPFRSDSGEFQAQEIGLTLADFADERWLDIRSENVRRIMMARLDLAKSRGFDGVEPDNVDGYANRSGFPLSAADQLAFNRFIANEAHRRGLSVGLKNDLDQIPQLVEYFDFAVNEQCHEFRECDALTLFVAAGKPVFNAEYQSRLANNAGAREAVCADSRALNIRTLILPLALDDAFRFSCEE